MSVGLLIVDKLAKKRARISAVIVKNAIDVSIKTYAAWLAICTDALNSCISEGKYMITKLCNIAAILQLK